MANEQWVLVVRINDRAETEGVLATRVFGPWRNRNLADSAAKLVREVAEQVSATWPGRFAITATVLTLEPRATAGTGGSLLGLVRELRTVADG